MNDDVGRIIEVNGVDVKAKLFSLLPPFLIINGKPYSAPKINSFVKTKVGLDVIICQIVGEYNVEDLNSKTDYYMDLRVKGYIENGKFIQGLRMLPIVSSNISLLSEKEYNIIFQYNKESSFRIGQDLFEQNRSIYINCNHVIPSHVGVFGNTGSGKSNTLALILQRYLNLLLNVSESKNSRILIFDLNNEYGDEAICSRNLKTIYTLSTSSKSKDRIPFNFNDLTEDDMGVLLNATSKMQMPVLKYAFKQLKKENDESYYIKYLTSILRNKQKDLFNSIRFNLQEYIGNIEDIFWSEKHEKFCKIKNDGQWYFSDNDDFYSEVVSKIIINLPDNSLDRLKFELYFSVAKECVHGVNGEYLTPLLSRAEKIFDDLHKIIEFENNEVDVFGDNNIAIVQLADVNTDMTMTVTSLLSNALFSKQIKSKGNEKVKSIINIVIDEAHNILYKDDDSRIHNSTLYSFEKIVKEGRKFGIFLMIASQRPSDISNTVLSQLHNYFLHKLINPNDLYQIRKTVAFLDENSMNFLTVLAPGECILSGTCVAMPTFVKIDELSNESKPNSSNVVLIGDYGILMNSENRESSKRRRRIRKTHK